MEDEERRRPLHRVGRKHAPCTCPTSMKPRLPEAHELSRTQNRHRRVLHFEDVLISADQVGSPRKDCGQDVRVVFRVTGV